VIFSQSFITFLTSSIWLGSRPTVGSSKIRTSGFLSKPGQIPPSACNPLKVSYKPFSDIGNFNISIMSDICCFLLLFSTFLSSLTSLSTHRRSYLYKAADERAVRRSNIPIAYSKGFNPHPHIVFGASAFGGSDQRLRVC